MRTAALATVARLHPTIARRARRPSGDGGRECRHPRRRRRRRRVARRPGDAAPAHLRLADRAGGGDGGGARARRARGYVRGGDGGSRPRDRAATAAGGPRRGGGGARCDGRPLGRSSTRWRGGTSSARRRPSRARGSRHARAERLSAQRCGAPQPPPASDRAAAVAAPPPPRSARARRRSACSRSPPRCATDASVVEAARRALLKLDYAPFARRGEAVARQGPSRRRARLAARRCPTSRCSLLLKPDDAPLADDESYDAPAARLLLVDGSGAATAVDRLAANADDVHLTVRLRGGKTKKLVTLVVPAREWAGEVGRAAG